MITLLHASLGLLVQLGSRLLLRLVLLRLRLLLLLSLLLLHLFELALLMHLLLLLRCRLLQRHLLRLNHGLLSTSRRRLGRNLSSRATSSSALWRSTAC